jgi:hypothetical protein
MPPVYTGGMLFFHTFWFCPQVEIANLVDEPRTVYDSVADINVPTLADEPRMMFTV